MSTPAHFRPRQPSPTQTLVASATRRIKIDVPEDFITPPLFSPETPGSTPQQRALALRLGAEAVALLLKRAADTLRQETHAEAVREATAAFEAQLAEAEAAAAANLAKARAAAAKAEEVARAAHLRIEALEQSATEIRRAAAAEAKAAAQDLLKAKEEQVAQLQATLERHMDAVGTRMESLQNTMTKTFSSSKEKGVLGETLMEGFLKRAYDCDVQVVAKEQQTADIRMTRASGAVYFWEAKNYTRMVSNEEVIKFRRDLALHPDVRGGVLVSLRQGIVGKTRGGDIDIEFLPDGRFILYLSNFMNRDDPVFYLQTLRPFLDTVEATTRPLKEEEEAVRALEAKAALVANLLRSHAAGVAKHKNSLVGHKKRMDSMFSEFQGYILEAEAQLQTLLRVSMGTEEAAAAAATEVETALSPLVFKKERLADCGDDRTREFVKWLLGQVEVREGTQVELKEVLERARVAGYGEKWVRGLREELFQETAWAKGARFLMGMRWLALTAQKE